MEVRHGAKKQEKKSKRKRKKKVEGRLFSSGAVSVETRRGHSVLARTGQENPGKSAVPACLTADNQFPTYVCGTLLSL